MMCYKLSIMLDWMSMTERFFWIIMIVDQVCRLNFTSLMEQFYHSKLHSITDVWFTFLLALGTWIFYQPMEKTRKENVHKICNAICKFIGQLIEDVLNLMKVELYGKL